KGMRVSDYTCRMDSSACTGDGALIAAATAACQRDIDKQLIDFIKGYCGGGIFDAVLHDAVGDVVGLAIGYLIKISVTKAAGLSLPILGAALLADSFVDLAIVISTLNRMKNAAARAKQLCCKCSETPCSNVKQNTSPLEIIRWYWGSDRSFEQTEAEAQDYADKTYNCAGSCATGSCKPKIYIIEWSQGGFGMTRTKIKYDVFCECN